MSKTAYLRVRNWDRWQYRADRNLPWIKVYRDLLLDPDFLALSDVERGHLMCIWLAASANNGAIPDDANVVQRLISSEVKPDLERLLSLQFLERTGKRRRRKCAPNREDKNREEKIREETPLSPSEKTADLPDWLASQTWDAWVQHRREIGKTLKPSTVAAQWRKLDKLRAEGHDPADVIEHSIAGGYQGLFPPTPQRNGAGKPNGGHGPPEWWKLTAPQRMAAAEVLQVSTRGKGDRELFATLSERYAAASPDLQASVAEALQ